MPLDTQRYSVPGHVGEEVRVRALAFHIEILAGEEVIATHKRCFGQEPDLIEPWHYLTAMTQRPGAFEHAIPMRRWRAEWPPSYATVLAELRQRWPAARGLREFLSILELHQDHPPDLLAQASQAALALAAVHRDGVQWCLRQWCAGQDLPVARDLSGHDRLAGIGQPPVNLGQYDTLLSGR